MRLNSQIVALRIFAVAMMCATAAWKFSRPTPAHEANDAEVSAGFPAVVGLEMLDEKNTVKGLCTGSVIRDDLVLTAAHCFAAFGATKVRVWDRLGDPLQQKNLLSIEHVLFPGYAYTADSDDATRRAYATDVAIAVFAKQSFNAAQIGKVANHEPKYDETVTVIGYGTEWDHEHTHMTRKLLTWNNKIVTTFDQLAHAIMISTTEASDHAAALSAGQSGGPLLSSTHEIYGIAHELSTRAVLDPAQPHSAGVDSNSVVSARYINVNDPGIASFIKEIVAADHPSATTVQHIRATPIAARR